MNIIGKTRMCVAAVGILAVGTGCVSAIMEAHGYKKATREQILAPLTPSFQIPTLGSPIAVQPKERLVGKWTSSYVMDSASHLLSMGYLGPSMTMTSHQTYWFFEDGACKMLILISGKETSWNGKWSYDNAGILTVSGAGGDGQEYSMKLKLSWLSPTEFVARFADVSEYEAMLRKPENVRSVHCHYDASGALHTQMIIDAQGNEAAHVSVQGPQVYERDGDAE